MEHLPKISVVTPSYNQSPYLRETIVSVLSQKNCNAEYMVVDGASTDNSGEIIKEYASQLAYWASEPDRGQSHAINKGLEKCSGEVFNWLCSDDYLEEGALENISELFKDPLVRVVYGRFKMINEPPDQEDRIMDGIMFSDSPEKTFARTSLTQPVAYWRTEDIRKFGGINERMHYFMDLEIWFKYLLTYGLTGIKRTEKVLANYRVHTASKTFKEMDNTRILPHSAFNIEKNNMFFFLAKHYGLGDKIQTAIKGLMNCIDEEYVMAPVPDRPALDVRKAINYYLYDFLRRYYYSGDNHRAKELSSCIESSQLDREDRRGLMYLKRKLFIKKITGKL